MIKFGLYFLLTLLMVGCSIKNNIINKVSSPGYLALPVPFNIYNYDECINIENLTGKVVFSLFVTSEGDLKYFNIYYLELNSLNGDAVVSYSNYSTRPISIEDYPDNIICYYRIFENYLSNIEFVKKEHAKADKINQFFLMNRICRK